MDGPYPEELLLCGGYGEGAGGAGAGDPQPAAAGGREGLLAGLPHPGHVRVASVVLQQQHLYRILFRDHSSITSSRGATHYTVSL